MDNDSQANNNHTLIFIGIVMVFGAFALGKRLHAEGVLGLILGLTEIIGFAIFLRGCGMQWTRKGNK